VTGADTTGNGNGFPRRRDRDDPTENVYALVDAAMRRQDDLRVQDAIHAREMREADTRRIDEKAELRAAYEDKLRQAESARIDAIRAVDVGAVNRAAEVSATAAAALAAQLVATAEASRAQVSAAAGASVTSLAAALEPIQKDIRDLRDAQSRGQGGKEQVTETREVQGETRLNQGQMIAFAILLVAVLSLVLLYATKK
jgi:hypothetical protein